MIVYRETVSNFIRDCNIDGTGALRIGSVVSDKMRFSGINYFDKSQIHAWEASLPEIAKVLANSRINGECDVAVEYKMHQSRDRIDFLICGDDDACNKNVVVIELKQWSSVSRSNKKDFVHTFGGHGEGDYWHPSYQATNYSNILINFNEYIQKEGVNLPACSYLHNMDKENEVLLGNTVIFPLVAKSPVFYAGEADKLGDFISKFIKHPNKKLLYDIENSRIVPSTYLADMLTEAIQGNDFFSYDEAQATAVAQIVSDVSDAIYYDSKETIIIKGGAGTGKSVVAINALGQMIHGNKKGKKHSLSKLNAVYITSNAAPRYLYTEELIKDDFTKKAINELFKYPTVCVGAPENFYDCVLVDEAHRIYDFKGGVGIKAGTHVLEEIIRSARVSVFFIDDDQAVTTTDFATIDRIEEAAYKCHSRVIKGPELELKTQFRVSGGETYIGFIKSFLGYNNDFSKFIPEHYDFRVFDSASEMLSEIKEKDNYYKKTPDSSGKCRLVAGYTYDWSSKSAKRDADVYDIILDGGAFKAKWNLRNSEVGQKYSWANDPDSVEEVGCIHSSQGLDLNYCGVIIGKDLTYRDGKLHFNREAVAKTDKNSGIKKASQEVAEKLIRNTYYVLLTRGMHGTFVYCEDEGLREYLKSFLTAEDPAENDNVIDLYYDKEPYSRDEEYVYIPIVGEISAGHEHFSEDDVFGCIAVPNSEFKSLVAEKHFYLSVSGDSMIGAGINDGDNVLIRIMGNPKGDIKNGDIIACQLHGDRATLKTFYKQTSGVILQPQNPAYEPIFVPWEDFDTGEARIIGKMIK